MWTGYRSLVDHKYDLEASESGGFFNCWAMKK